MNLKQVRRLVREALKSVPFIVVPTTLSGFKDALVDALDGAGAKLLASSLRDANVLHGGRYVAVQRAWREMERDRESGTSWSERVRKHVGPMVLDLTGNAELARRVVKRLE
jgi:hypothetical protein